LVFFPIYFSVAGKAGKPLVFGITTLGDKELLSTIWSETVVGSTIGFDKSSVFCEVL